MARWIASDAHDELDATGRGIYREMLDYCYVQGSVSGDPVVLARRCACTREELRDRWDVLERYFYRDGDGKLRNRYADQFREEYAEFLEVQRANGRRGGRPRNQTETHTKPTANPWVSDGKPTANPPLTQAKTHPKTHPESGPKAYNTLHYTKQHNTTRNGRGETAAFETWLELYPKKTRTDAASRAWISLEGTGEITEDEFPVIMAGTQRWIESEEWAKEDGKFIPDPANFLMGNDKHSGRMWKDHPKPAAEHKPHRKAAMGVDPNIEWTVPADWKKAENED